MKKNRFALIIVMLFMLFQAFIPVFATTKQDVLNALNSTYEVAGKNYKVPQKWVNAGVEFLDNNELTSEQCDTILWGIHAGIEVAREEGTTDRRKISDAGMQKLMYIASEVSLATDVDIDEVVEEVEEIINEPVINNNENIKSEEISETPQEVDLDLSGEIDIQTSGEVSGEMVNEISEEKEEIATQPNSTASYKKILKEADTKASNRIKIGIFLIIIILFINIFIIYLLFKAKWNKILRYVLIVIFVLLTVILLIALVLALANFKRFRLMYRLYLMFN